MFSFMFVDQGTMDMFVVSVWAQLQLTWKCLERKKYTYTRLQKKIETHRQDDQRVALLETRKDQVMQKLDKLIQRQGNTNSTPHGSKNELLW